jgi:PilZ domain
LTNTRDSERVPIPGQVTGEVTVYEPMAIIDLSDRGALVETTFALQLDSLHEFRLSLGTRSVVVKGRIAHCKIGELQEGTVLYRSGIEFIEPTDHALSAIHAFVEALKFAASAPPGIVEAELAED